MTQQAPRPALTDLTVAVAERRLLEALATSARTESPTGTVLLDVIAMAGVVAEQWDVAGDQVMASVWRSVANLAWATQVDYRRSTMEG